MQHNGEILASVLPAIPVMPQRDPIDAATRTACQVTSELTRESARFLSIRLQRYADLELGLARSSRWMDPMSCFMEFSRLTFLDYTRELERAPFLLGRISEEAMLAMESQTARARAPAFE